jgi:hypothetical protein
MAIGHGWNSAGFCRRRGSRGGRRKGDGTHDESGEYPAGVAHVRCSCPVTLGNFARAVKGSGRHSYVNTRVVLPTNSL